MMNHPGKVSNALSIDGSCFSLEEIEAIAGRELIVQLCPQAAKSVRNSREVVERVIQGDQAVYGLNTGFGRLCTVKIGHDDLAQLQLNLIRSHCCGFGEPLDLRTVRAMIGLRANVLAKGLSGVRPKVIEALLALLEHEIYPEIPSRGSVGASGDLAPLSHLALVLIGEGWCLENGLRRPAIDVLNEKGLEPIVLEPKEGLSLINGTQCHLALGALSAIRAERLVAQADMTASLTVAALDGFSDAFDERIHSSRPHLGQIESADLISRMLTGTERRDQVGVMRKVQDAYSLRCTPQVHGAARGVLHHVRQVLEIESGSATDNPLVFETGEILSGGNFHGAPVAMALDYACIALADIVSISERRVDKMLNPDTNNGATAFLAPTPGLSSGFMIAHVTMAALLSEIRVLASPASIDNTPTSAGTEDHVSLGMTAALKLSRIIELAEACIGIELICATEALHRRGMDGIGEKIQNLASMVSQIVPRLSEDRVLSDDIKSAADLVSSGKLLSEIN